MHPQNACPTDQNQARVRPCNLGSKCSLLREVPVLQATIVFCFFLAARKLALVSGVADAGFNRHAGPQTRREQTTGRQSKAAGRQADHRLHHHTSCRDDIASLSKVHSLGAVGGAATKRATPFVWGRKHTHATQRPGSSE